MAGEFAKLLPFKWRDKHYPLNDIELTLAHDLVVHKYHGVDGARIDDVGVDPLRIRATIPIGNSIFPGPQEKWTAGDLYPTALRQFIIDFAKKTTGLMQHPEFGEIACKPETMSFKHSGAQQDSTSIQASWVETIDDDVISNSNIWTDVAGAGISSGSPDLDVDYRKLAPTLPTLKDDLASIGRKVRSLLDAAFVASYRAAGVANEIIYQTQAIQRSVDRLMTPETWPVTRFLQSAMSTAYDARQTILANRGIGIYVVPGDTTLAAVSRSLPGDPEFGEVIRMNPNLVRSPLVEKGTSVRYPVAA